MRRAHAGGEAERELARDEARRAGADPEALAVKQLALPANPGLGSVASAYRSIRQTRETEPERMKHNQDSEDFGSSQPQRPRKQVRRDVIVVGGGQAGRPIGYFVARQGRDFTIVQATDGSAAAWRLQEGI